MSKTLWPKTIPLATPVKYGDEMLTEIVFQQPCAAHLRELAPDSMGNPFAASLDLVSAISSWPRGVIDRVELGPDTTALLEAVSPFVVGLFQIGASPSAS